jgi:hypothetical protein
VADDSPVQRQVDAYNARDVEAFLSCYATDVVVRHGDGRVLMTGHDELRAAYTRMFANNAHLHADIVTRLHAGEWVLDEEVVTLQDEEMHALVGYRVDGGLIRDVVMLTAP